MLAALSLDFDDRRSAGDVEAAVSRIEREIEAAFPEVTRVFVEARDRNAPSQTETPVWSSRRDHMVRRGSCHKFTHSRAHRLGLSNAPGRKGRMAVIGASRSLRRIPAIVSFLGPQPTLSLVGGNRSSCPISDLRADGFERLSRVEPRRSQFARPVMPLLQKRSFAA